MKRTLLIAGALCLAALAIWAAVVEAEKRGWVHFGPIEVTQPEPELVDTEEQWKSDMRSSTEFQDKVEAELDILWYEHLQREAERGLQEKSEQGFSGETISHARTFIERYNPELAAYAHEIVKLPRWRETVAIAAHETKLCTIGVGSSKNNCGGIKRGGGFAYYDNAFDGLVAISTLISGPRYGGLTISEMNGTYCVYEEGPTGTGPCPNWTQTITRNLVALAG